MYNDVQRWRRLLTWQSTEGRRDISRRVNRWFFGMLYIQLTAQSRNQEVRKSARLLVDVDVETPIL